MAIAKGNLPNSPNQLQLLPLYGNPIYIFFKNLKCNFSHDRSDKALNILK